MKIFVIHDSSNQERAQNIKTQFESQLGTHEYEILPAIIEPSMARKGISKSHKACVQRAKDLDLPEVCIMEDGILFLTPEALGLFKLTYHMFKTSMLPENWDMFFAGIYSGELKELYYGVNENKICRVDDRLSGLHCYIVNSEFYDSFLSADEAYNLDYYLSESIRARSFCVSPFLAIQGDFKSSNHNNMTEINNKLSLKYKLYQ